MRQTVIVGLVALLGLAGMAGAQTPPEKPTLSTVAKASDIVPKELETPPVVSPEDSLKLANFMLLAENLAFKVQTLQAEQEKTRAAFNGLLTGLQKPGYHLERDAKAEAFVYVKDAPKPEPEKPAEKKPEKK